LVCGLDNDIKSLKEVTGKCLKIANLTGGKQCIYWASENSLIELQQTDNLESTILGKRTKQKKVVPNPSDANGGVDRV